MNPQTIILIIISLSLLKRSPRTISLSAIAYLLLSIPLFATWTFFTAQLLVEFAFLQLLIASSKSIFQSIVKSKK